MSHGPHRLPQVRRGGRDAAAPRPGKHGRAHRARQDSVHPTALVPAARRLASRPRVTSAQTSARAQPAESSIGGYTTPALTEGRAGTEPQRHGAHHERAFPRDGGAPSRWNASAREVGGMAFVALSAFWVLLDGETPGLSHGVDVGEDSNGSSRDGRFYELVRERWCDVQARSKRPGSTRSCPCICPTPMSVL